MVNSKGLNMQAVALTALALSITVKAARLDSNVSNETRVEY